MSRKMHSVEAKIQARDVATDRLHELTAFIAMGALAALGLFGVIAATTVPRSRFIGGPLSP